MKAQLMAALILSTMAIQAQQLEISISPTSAATRARLDWPAVPGQTYSVYSKSNLLSSSWINVTPAGLMIPDVLGWYESAVTNQAQFFGLVKEDTDPPSVTGLVPADGAIAVVSNTSVVIVLSDETGIDTNSLTVNIGPYTNLTLAGGGLSYSNGTVTFTPTGVWGAGGDAITNTLTVFDTLGHALSNYTWTFQLARPAVATNAFLPLIAPPEGSQTALSANLEPGFIRSLPTVHPLDGPANLCIIAVTSNTVVFSYTGTAPVITNGTCLVSFDAANPFYRQATSNTIDVGQQQITAWTSDMYLTDLISEGSFDSTIFSAAQPSASQQALGTVGLKLHVDFPNDLSGKVFYKDGGLKLWLPAGSWDFAADVDVAADISSHTLRSFDASAAGTLTLSLSPEALFSQTANGDGSGPLISPVTKHFGGMVGFVPVWVSVTMELNAGYDYDASATASLDTTLSAEKQLTFSLRLRANQWTSGVDNPPIVLEADPIVWQLQGDASAKIYIQPKLTVLVESLAGLWVDLDPYAELDGSYQANPLQYQLGLYFGLSSTLGVESRIWYSEWGDKPEWPLFDQKWPLWSTNYPPDSAIVPTFISGFPDQTVVQGGSVTLSGSATGTPAPGYKWYFNGSKISGATGPEYTISPAQSGHQGTYSVQACNSAGSVQASCYVTVSSGAGDYLIVDLSAGPSASSYPVSYLTGVPAGGWTDDYKTTKMVFRRIPAGTFIMGSPTNELGRYSDEVQHQVTLTQPFYMGVFEVTQKQWERVMGTWPSYFNNASYRDARPVEQVSYNDIRGASAGVGWPANGNVDATSFMGLLRARTGKAFDLPTESQWEYAGRAGTTTALNSGYNLSSTSSDAHMSAVGRYWYNGGSGYTQNGDTSVGTAKVGSYLPNSWGLYDIHGNVWDWCLDWYDAYPGTVTDPCGPSSSPYSNRVVRGGGWGDDASYCRVGFRLNGDPGDADIGMGFRVALPPGQ